MKTKKPKILKFKNRETAIDFALKTKRRIEQIKTPESQYKYKIKGNLQMMYS